MCCTFDVDSISKSKYREMDCKISLNVHDDMNKLREIFDRLLCRGGPSEFIASMIGKRNYYFLVRNNEQRFVVQSAKEANFETY